MKRIALCGIAIGLAASALGCGVHSVRSVDVTHNPAFVGSYKAGQTYRIKIPVHIMSIIEDRQFDVTSDVIWTDENYRRYDAREPLFNRAYLIESSIPAGAMITIRRLEYRVDEFSLEPFCLGAMYHRFPELLAIGELSSGSRRATVIAPIGPLRGKHDVSGPDDSKVWVIPPDPDVIEPIDPTTRPD